MTDKQLVRFAKSFRSGVLGRKSSAFKCFMVCAPLAPLLSAQGIDTELREGWVKDNDGVSRVNHYWLALPDGRVLDPTMDQFGPYPKVYLGEPYPKIHNGTKELNHERA